MVTLLSFSLTRNRPNQWNGQRMSLQQGLPILQWNGLMETSPNWQLPILWSGVSSSSMFEGPSLEWTDGCLSSGDFPYSIGMDRWTDGQTDRRTDGQTA